MVTVQQAPDFTLDHIKGHSVSFGTYRGRPVVLVFAGKDSGSQAREIVVTLRGRFAPDQLPVLSVLDMHSIPRLVQGIAKGQIQKGYNDAVREAQADAQARGWATPADPAQLVIMLMDWDGKVTSSYGLSGVDKQAVAVLIDENGAVRGYGAGAQGGQQILALFG
jgi:hypothetical protein